MLSGYDKRTVMGAGKLQLVSGSLSRRSLIFSGGAGQGIITLDVPEPEAIAATVAALLVLAACHRVFSRRWR